MKLAILVCLACSGCLWATDKSQTITGLEGRAFLGTDGHPQGGSLDAGAGYAGLSAHAELAERQVVRTNDPASYPAYGMGLALRLSLFGMLATDHRLERYFDIGGEAGVGASVAVGVPPSHVRGFGQGMYGAWAELGTIDAGDGYLAIVGGVRRESYQGPWIDQTQVLIGLAWRHRTVNPDGRGRWRD